MAEALKSCRICQRAFAVQFSYQVERSPDGTSSDSYYCSQACLARSHTSGAVALCTSCGGQMQVTHAAQVVYLDSTRHYVCSETCRRQLFDDQRRSAPASGEQRVADLPKVLAVFNHKGGTGKTTTAVTIAAGLAQMGRRTLLVDTDAQGNVGVSLGLGKTARSLYHVLVMGMPVQQAVIEARPGLDVLTSNETLAAAELYLAGRQQRDRVLAARLQSCLGQYDNVIVDCSPSLSLLNQNALVLSDSVLCPVACDYLSLVGVRQVVKTIKSVNRLLNHPVQLWGVLPTMYDKRARICNEALETLREHFAERCLPPVRSAMRVKEAPSQGKTLFEYDGGSNAADDYRAVVQLIVQGRAQSGPYLAIA